MSCKLKSWYLPPKYYLILNDGFQKFCFKKMFQKHCSKINCITRINSCVEVSKSKFNF